VSDIKIGQISVTLHEPPVSKAQIACGHVVLDVGYAAGYRFFIELKKIHEALLDAHAVLTARTNAGQTSPVEMHLARMLVELEVLPTNPKGDR
jgi:hypothetical protein